MRWIKRIDWTGNSYCAVAIDETGTSQQLPVAALADHQLSSSATKRIRVRTEFAAWRSVKDGEFLAALGFPEGTGSKHEIYEFQAAGKTFQVPALVLMKGLFRPFRGLGPLLFRPQSLENTVFPVGNGADPAVEFFCEPRATFRMNPSRSSRGILAALSWMYCFPSARRMWDSVMVKARHGVLGLRLPEGTASLVLHAFNHGDKWLVTDITVVTVATSEPPFEFAAGHATLIEFHYGSRLLSNGGKPPRQIPDLPGRNGEWGLSDSEWAVVEPLLTKQVTVRHTLRAIVDCILEKFGQGVAWSKLAVGSANRPAVVATYQRMLKDGRWAVLLDALKQLRQQSQES